MDKDITFAVKKSRIVAKDCSQDFSNSIPANSMIEKPQFAMNSWTSRPAVSKRNQQVEEVSFTSLSGFHPAASLRSRGKLRKNEIYCSS